MSAKRSLLVVDDSPDDIRVLMENLKQEYAVLAATSGEKGLDLAGKDPHPDVILMDVEMPGIDGYETCRRLKGNPETSGIDVIFVSAHDSTDEKMAGYEAGGCDYVIKPVQPEVLMQKVRLAFENQDVRTESQQEKDMAMETAMTAISSAGEQGVVLDFMRQSYTISTVDNLARQVVQSMTLYGLETSVQIRSSLKTANVCSREPMPPLEIELLERLKDAGRLKEHGARFIANYGNLSMLVKNMPEDTDKRGRLRDHLAYLLEGAEARLHAIEVGHQNQSGKLQMEQLMVESRQSLEDVKKLQEEQKHTAMRIMDQTKIDLEEAFMSWGLTEYQEKHLMQVVDAGVEKSLNNFETGVKIDEKLATIVEKMQNFSDEQ